MSLTEAAQQLQASKNYRVLQRVPPVESWNLQPAVGETVRACIVDCETTGLETDAEVCELGILPFDYCKETGRVVAVHVDEALSSFCQTEKPIPAEATAVHGITNEMVAGHYINDAHVSLAVRDAKLLIAHQARFDRGMTAKVWPMLDTVAWGCSWDDIDWRAAGYESGKLAYILFRFGYFYDGHRAINDCLATLFLLTQPAGENSALFAMLKRLREPLYKVTMKGTPIQTKGLLRDRGYRWNPAKRTWWKTVSDADAECDWFDASPIREGVLYAEKLPVTARHSAHLEAA